MAELLLELYSEEIPPQLQIAARSQIKQFIENTFEEENIKYKELSVYSSPTRLTLFVKDLAEKIKTEAKEIKGPKLGSPHQVIQGFLRAKNVSENDLIEKETEKGKFPKQNRTYSTAHSEASMGDDFEEKTPQQLLTHPSGLVHRLKSFSVKS